MIGVPDSPDRRDAMRTRTSQWRDMLWDDPAYCHDGDATVPHESIEQQRARLGVVIHGGRVWS
jgi:hypothetical protein